VSQSHWDDLAPALICLSPPLLRSVTSIFPCGLRARARWKDTWWEKGADPNYLCITWIVTNESLETALLNKICQIQRAMLHGCSSAGRLGKEAVQHAHNSRQVSCTEFLCAICREFRVMESPRLYTQANQAIKYSKRGLYTWSRHS
jgi:steroid 5-alpha reductase family enzyme